jgi:hypothetical protein
MMRHRNTYLSGGAKCSKFSVWKWICEKLNEESALVKAKSGRSGWNAPWRGQTRPNILARLRDARVDELRFVCRKHK